MTTTHPKPEALISTPAEAAQCPPCMADYDARWDQTRGYEGWSTEDRAEFAGPMPTCSRFDALPGEAFAHCNLCGSTDLVDTRSPFEVLAEAVANVALVKGDDEASILRRFDRQDVVERVRSIAAQADPGHCSDCTTWATRAAVQGVRF